MNDDLETARGIVIGVVFGLLAICVVLSIFAMVSQ